MRAPRGFTTSLSGTRWPVAIVLLVWATAASAQVRGVVVDETGLPLPGATLELREGSTILQTITSANDGTFEIPASFGGDLVTARLEGFEPLTVPRVEAARLVL